MWSTLTDLVHHEEHWLYLGYIALRITSSVMMIRRGIIGGVQRLRNHRDSDAE